MPLDKLALILTEFCVLKNLAPCPRIKIELLHDPFARKVDDRYPVKGNDMLALIMETKVVYTAKDGKSTKIFYALEWLAAMCSHAPDMGE